MPIQLKTLLPLFAVLIGLFLVARHFLIPESFGKYGHYRADAIDEIGALPAKYTGKTVCIDCHDTEAEQIASDAHSGLSCEVCHGPGARHVEDSDIKLKKPGTRKFCGQCHGLNSARKIEVINQVNTKEHQKERTNCIDCHNPHAVWELKD